MRPRSLVQSDNISQEASDDKQVAFVHKSQVTELRLRRKHIDPKVWLATALFAFRELFQIGSEGHAEAGRHTRSQMLTLALFLKF